MALVEFFAFLWAGFVTGIGTFWEEQVIPNLGVRLAQGVAALLVLLFAWVLSSILTGWVARTLEARKVHPNARWLMQRAVRFGVLVLGFLWVLGIFNIQPATVLTVIGAFGLALGLAMQDTVKNVVAGLYLLVEGTFRIGDRVDMRGQSGRVEGTYLRHTALRTEAGWRVVIPNNLLMNEVITNRTWYTGLEGGESMRVRVVQALDAYALAAKAAEGGEEEQVTRPEPPKDLVAAISEAVRASARDLPGGLPYPSPAITVESLAGGKLTLRLDIWVKQRQEALVPLFDRLRQCLPSPDITVVE